MDRVLKKIEEGMSHVQGGIDKGKVKLQEAQAIAQQRKIIRKRLKERQKISWNWASWSIKSKGRKHC